MQLKMNYEDEIKKMEIIEIFLLFVVLFFLIIWLIIGVFFTNDNEPLPLFAIFIGFMFIISSIIYVSYVKYLNDNKLKLKLKIDEINLMNE